MDEKEEGEISEEDSFGLSYQPVTRPDTSQYRPVTQHVPSSDDDYTSDSDLDAPHAPKRKRPNISSMETCPSESRDSKDWMDNGNSTEGRTPALKAKRRNNVWSTVMEEQVLAQEIGGFGLKKRLDTGYRSVESYDYTQSFKLQGLIPDQSDSDEEEEGEEEEETEEIKNKRMSRKRHMRGRLSYRNPKSSYGQRELVNVEDSEDLTDRDLGLKLAEALMERKPELIVRVIAVLGRSKALQVYKQTQEVERDGGLMIMNGSRRRTSGGVYLMLLKSWPGVGKEELAGIFPPEDEAGRHQQWGRREKAHRKRERHESKPQSESVGEEGLHLGDLFSDDPGGTKCPGSTPVTTPQHSDNEAEDVAAPLINKLSPSALPELVPPTAASPPPVVPKKDSPSDLPRSQPLKIPLATSGTYNGEFVDLGATEGRTAGRRAAEAYDDDFLEIHTNEEMELF
ncbi:hypothetical protein Pmani_034373 [Petrolisthes manimaculis]|uniref:Phosphorylated adapter RNA export protein n=1 Tax=Petrolisthes manimaculis TaxID=1843537 RepID=A0AAE1NP47_9EUCA|nr:hypothetical protein Pmani_034575 [Petrolisthes manimaculis]KAK4292895.1 hypothetical protein Pmani_034373 [Petrolisthes manimaculis]